MLENVTETVASIKLATRQRQIKERLIQMPSQHRLLYEVFKRRYELDFR